MHYGACYHYTTREVNPIDVEIRIAGIATVGRFMDILYLVEREVKMEINE